MKRAVLYGRVSGDDRNRTGGQNLADQLRLCGEYATERGYEVVEELAEDDRGASGASFDLPQLSRALEMARDQQFDLLIVRELDRLSRDLAKQLIVEQELERAGVTIEYVLYDFPDTPEGRLNKNLRAMLAEYEREKIKQRMQRGTLRKVRNGEAINRGHPPFGYRNVKIDGKAQLAIREDEAKTVHLIFQWYTEGDGEQGPMSIRQISKRLTKLRVPTYSDLRQKGDCTEKTVARRGQWERSSVGRILKNETYTGTWYYGQRSWDEEDWIPVNVPRIIDDATWEETQRRRKKNKRLAKRNRKYDYLLASRLTCGECGRTMRGIPVWYRYKGERKWVYLYYACYATKAGYPCAMKHTSFRADYVDAIAWKWIKQTLSSPEKVKKALREYQANREELNKPLQDRIDLIDEMTAKTETKRGRLLDLYVDGAFERETLDERKLQYDQEIDGLQEKRAKLAAQIHKTEFSEELLQSIIKFSRKVAGGMEDADEDFERRRHIIDMLDITGELSVIDGEKVVSMHGVLGDLSDIVSSTPGDSPTRRASPSGDGG